jgi:hypothetical protein
MKKSLVNRILEYSIIFCVCICALYPINPSRMPVAARDSGVFLYVGQRILNGELPYRDVWDHKPPVIFYINALGLFISNNSRWGIWILELTSLFLAALFGYYLFKNAFGSYPALCGSLVWLSGLSIIIDGGNYTAEYALPFQFMALWLFYRDNKFGFSLWRWFLIGLTGGIVFFTQQTGTGIWVTIIIYLVLAFLKRNQIKRRLGQFFSLSAGVLSIFIIIILFFGMQGAFYVFLDSAFIYNLNYLSPTSHNLTLLLVLITGYIFGLTQILFKKYAITELEPLLLIGLIDLPIELSLIGVSGRNYSHYYISILPVLSILSVFFLWAILRYLSLMNIPNIIKSAVQLIIAGVLLWYAGNVYKNQVTVQLEVANQDAILDVAQYVKAETTSNDYVLVWGAESFVNFYTFRKCPTRFVYQLPFYTQGYVDKQIISEFIRDVIRNQPQLIVDTGEIAPLFDFPIQTENTREGVEYIKSHYRQVKNFQGWTVYEYSGIERVP